MSKTIKNPRSKAETEVKIDNLINYGRKEIKTKSELEKFPIGSLISYTNNNNEFRIGGFIVKFASDYFIYITLDFKTKYRVKYKNIHKMWIGDVYKVNGDFISMKKTTQTPTNFKVEIDGIILYYGKAKFFADRFMKTQKFKTLIMWHDYFKQKNKN